MDASWVTIAPKYQRRTAIWSPRISFCLAPNFWPNWENLGHQKDGSGKLPETNSKFAPENGWFHQEFQVPKMEVLFVPYKAVFLGWGNFPYISRICTAFFGWRFLHFRYQRNVWWWLEYYDPFPLGSFGLLSRANRLLVSGWIFSPEKLGGQGALLAGHRIVLLSF